MVSKSNSSTSQRDDDMASVTQHKLRQHQAEHIILGAGLIGAYLGACFAYAKQPVTLLCRSAVFEKLKKHYSISDFEGNEFDVNKQAQLRNIDEGIDIDRKADFLWLTVKCYSLEDAIDDIRKCIDENTVILCCQNGVANHLVIKHAFPHNPVIRVMVPFNVVTDNPAGHFHRGSQGSLSIESQPYVADSVRWLSRQIHSKHLPVDISFDMTALQWAKLQLNLGNAVNALANIPVKEMLEIAQYRLFMAQLMRELLSITRKKQIKLPKIANVPNKWIPVVLSLPNALFRLVAQKMLAIDPKVRTSMYWDIHHGKKTEIDYLNAKIVSIGAQLGIKTPFNQFVVDNIKLAEKGQAITPDEFLDAVTTMNKQR
jgi:2-dehydropantoate 2-reductase